MDEIHFNFKNKKHQVLLLFKNEIKILIRQKKLTLTMRNSGCKKGFNNK